MTVWTPKNNVGGAIVMESTAAIPIHTPVKLTTNGIVAAGDGDEVLGVAAMAASASGELITVWTQGIFTVRATAARAMGTRVALNATGGVDAGTSGDAVVGIVVSADIAINTDGDVLLYSDSALTIP